MINEGPHLKVLQVIPSLGCNARCSFCHIWGKTGWAHHEPANSSKEDIHLPSLFRFIDEAIAHTPGNTFWLLITGGEALLYKNLEALLVFARNKRLPVILLTNGLLLKKYASLLVDNVCSLSVSIDGPPAVHNNIRGISDLYNRACEGIEMVINLKRQRNSFTPTIVLNCVISPVNAMYINEMIDALEERFKNKGIHFKVDQDVSEANDISVYFEPLLYTTTVLGNRYETFMKDHFKINVSNSWKGFVNNKFDFDIKQVKAIVQKYYQRYHTNAGSFVDLEEYFGNVFNTFGRKCLTPWHNLTVREDGNAYLCPDYKDYSLGNIQSDSFTDIWMGEKAIKFRNLAAQHLLPVCYRCCGLFLDYTLPTFKLPAAKQRASIPIF